MNPIVPSSQFFCKSKNLRSITLKKIPTANTLKDNIKHFLQDQEQGKVSISLTTYDQCIEKKNKIKSRAGKVIPSDFKTTYKATTIKTKWYE